jgi:hypothetical protein
MLDDAMLVARLNAESALQRALGHLRLLRPGRRSVCASAGVADVVGP